MIAKKKQAKPAPDQTQPFYLKKKQFSYFLTFLLMTLASKTNPLLSIKGKERIKKLTLKN